MIKSTDDILCFSKEINDYILDYVPKSNVLVISFESAGGDFSKKDKKRLGWGKKFFLDSPWSLLWIKPCSPNWYRGEELHLLLEQLSCDGFFDKFDKVVLIGGSMGGYAALAFSSLIKDSIVVSLNPQISLCDEIVPWEKRKFLSKGLEQNWNKNSKYVNAALESDSAKAIYVVYDPYDKNDKKHASLITNKNTIHCKIPFVGHNIPTALLQMKCLKRLINSVIDNSFDINSFRKYVKNRKELDIYHEKVIISLFKRRHFKSSVELYKKAVCENKKIRVNNYPMFKKHLLSLGNNAE